MFKISSEIETASLTGTSIVALESTLISHGFPYPENIRVATSAEAAIRESGSIPATIAVIDGEVRVGLTSEEIELLASDENVEKISRRNLPVAVTAGLNFPKLGATTVSATMILAHQAGIEIFATGGIGGVHREVTETMDISADLFELAHTPVAVVCSGPKAILDLNRTREYLETSGVTVVGFGCNEMPAFWSKSSGIGVDVRVDNAAEAANVIRARSQLGIQGSVLICNPVRDEFAIEANLIEEWIMSCSSHVPRGANATPWILAEIAKRSSGRSIDANKQLIIDNARLAGKIAKALAD